MLCPRCVQSVQTKHIRTHFGVCSTFSSSRHAFSHSPEMSSVSQVSFHGDVFAHCRGVCAFVSTLLVVGTVYWTESITRPHYVPFSRPVSALSPKHGVCRVSTRYCTASGSNRLTLELMFQRRNLSSHCAPNAPHHVQHGADHRRQIKN